MTVQQAIGAPRCRFDAGSAGGGATMAFLNRFVRAAVASRFIHGLIKKHGVDGKLSAAVEEEPPWHCKGLRSGSRGLRVYVRMRKPLTRLKSLTPVQSVQPCLRGPLEAAGKFIKNRGGARDPQRPPPGLVLCFLAHREGPWARSQK